MANGNPEVTVGTHPKIARWFRFRDFVLGKFRSRVSVFRSESPLLWIVHSPGLWPRAPER